MYKEKVGMLGFEPRIKASKASVIPFHHIPIGKNTKITGRKLLSKSTRSSIHKDIVIFKVKEQTAGRPFF